MSPLGQNFPPFGTEMILYKCRNGDSAMWRPRGARLPEHQGVCKTVFSGPADSAALLHGTPSPENSSFPTSLSLWSLPALPTISSV